MYTNCTLYINVTTCPSIHLLSRILNTWRDNCIASWFKVLREARAWADSQEPQDKGGDLFLHVLDLNSWTDIALHSYSQLDCETPNRQACLCPRQLLVAPVCFTRTVWHCGTGRVWGFDFRIFKARSWQMSRSAVTWMSLSTCRCLWRFMIYSAPEIDLKLCHLTMCLHSVRVDASSSFFCYLDVFIQFLHTYYKLIQIRYTIHIVGGGCPISIVSSEFHWKKPDPSSGSFWSWRFRTTWRFGLTLDEQTEWHKWKIKKITRQCWTRWTSSQWFHYFTHISFLSHRSGGF